MLVFPWEIQQKWNLDEFKKSRTLQNVSISIGNNAKMKSRQTQTKGGTPKIMIFTVVFCKFVPWTLGDKKEALYVCLCFLLFFDDFGDKVVTKRMAHFTFDGFSWCFLMILVTKKMAHYAFGTLAGPTATFWNRWFRKMNMSKDVWQKWGGQRGEKLRTHNRIERFTARTPRCKHLFGE